MASAVSNDYILEYGTIIKSSIRCSGIKNVSLRRCGRFKSVFHALPADYRLAVFAERNSHFLDRKRLYDILASVSCAEVF